MNKDIDTVTITDVAVPASTLATLATLAALMITPAAVEADQSLQRNHSGPDVNVTIVTDNPYVASKVIRDSYEAKSSYERSKPGSSYLTLPDQPGRKSNSERKSKPTWGYDEEYFGSSQPSTGSD